MSSVTTRRTRARALVFAVLIFACWSAVLGCRALTAPASCSGGAELVANGCYCAKGTVWNGQTCQGTPDPSGCQGGGYWFGPDQKAGGGCFCLYGYTLQNGQCVQLQCSGGAVAGVNQCECPSGTQWDGAQCTAPAAPPEPDPSASCAAGTTWDGTQCAATGDATAPPPATPTPVDSPHADGRACRSALLKKGYAPDQLGNCDGTNDRCAVALIGRGFAPDQLPNCRGVDGACAEQVIKKGYAPDQLANCRR